MHLSLIAKRKTYGKRAERPYVWVSEPSCGGEALLTVMAAMQSSVLSSVVHCKAPPLTALHSSHLTFSWWPTAHHSTLWGSSTPRTGGEKPGIQKKSKDVSGNLAPLATERLPSKVLTDSSRVGMSQAHIIAHSCLSFSRRNAELCTQKE